jgi:hypothetical protein
VDLEAFGKIKNGQAVRLDVTSAQDVCAAVEHALFATDPQRRYLVVPNEPQAQRTIRKQIAQLVELNEGHVYTYDRATLIKMLDEALAGSRGRTERSRCPAAADQGCTKQRSPVAEP